MFRFSLRGLLILIAIFGLLLASVLAASSWLDPFDNRRFDSADWFSNRSKARGYMARDAIRLVRGRSKKEVIELLGPGGDPSYPFWHPRYKRFRDFDGLAYDIGNWSFQGMDDAWINILFDSKGEVFHAEIYGH